MTLFIIPLKAPLQPAWIAAIIFLLSSNNNNGTQSAVKIAMGIFFWSVIIASALILFLNLKFLSKNKNLLLCIWWTKKIFFEFLSILFLTISKFFFIFFLLSLEPFPQLRLLYIPLDLPPILLKNPWLIFFCLDSFFEIISFKILT